MFPIGNWMDTYANLLYKLDRKDEALMWESAALALDPKNTEIQTTLSRMKNK